jgi:hypothetical protein
VKTKAGTKAGMNRLISVKAISARLLPFAFRLLASNEVDNA